MENNKIITGWHRKSIWSGRLLNFGSHHPIFNKLGIIFVLVDTAIKLSDIKFHYENLIIVKNTLLKNSYPSELFI